MALLVFRGSSTQYTSLLEAIVSAAKCTPVIDVHDLDQICVEEVSMQSTGIRCGSRGSSMIESAIALGLPSARCHLRSHLRSAGANVVAFYEAEARASLQSALLLGNIPLRNAGAINPTTLPQNSPSWWLHALAKLGWVIGRKTWKYRADGQRIIQPENETAEIPYLLTVTHYKMLASPGGKIHLPNYHWESLIADTQLLMAQLGFSWLNLFVTFPRNIPLLHHASQYFPPDTPLSHYRTVALDLLT